MDNGIFSKKLRAGRRRTYFFDVRTTKSDDYYITITESKKKFDGDGYERHKLFLYKEDFNKFVTALSSTVDYVKTDLMPDYDFEEFDREAEEITPNQYISEAKDKDASLAKETEQLKEDLEKQNDEIKSIVEDDFKF